MGDLFGALLELALMSVLVSSASALLLYGVSWLKAGMGKFNQADARSAKPFWSLLIIFAGLSQIALLKSTYNVASSLPEQDFTLVSILLFIYVSLIALLAVFIFRRLLDRFPIENEKLPPPFN